MRNILFFILGTVIGSFLGVVVDRYPERSLLHPRSHCEHCQHDLTLLDLVPLLSALLLQFRCRHCRQRFSSTSFHLEWTSALAFLMIPRNPMHLSLCLFLLMGNVICCYDLKNYAYPFSIWLMVQPYFWWTFGLTWQYLALSALAYLFYRIPIGIGEGDALYLASTSYFLPIETWPSTLLLASLLGIGWAWLKKTDRIPFVPCLHGAVFISFWLNGYLLI